ncbi:MAG: T9SS type A sorting domain-containing protein [Bacteroidota bacterium]
MKKVTTILCILISFIGYGQSWFELPNAPAGQGRFDDVFFLNEDLGWAANGPSGRVYKTTDAGQNWQLQYTHPGYNRNIEFLDENIGFLGTLESIFYKTTNGGDTWEQVSMSPNPNAICGLDAVGTSTVYGCGAWFSPAHVIKSTDAGENWTYKDMSAHAEALVEVLFIDELHGYVSGASDQGGIILETLDGGDSWTEIFNTNVQGDYIWKMQLMENNTLIIGSVQSNSQGKLVRSADSGATWEVYNAPENFVQAVGFVTPQRGWMGGHNTGFHETNDGGQTWSDIGLGFSLNRFFFIDSSVAYCSGETIYKYEDEFGISDFGGAKREDLKIVVAPNPVKDELVVEIHFEYTDNLLLDLYDLNGRWIKRLKRDQIPGPEIKRYTFDFNYPAGSYFLDIHTNNGRRTRSLIKN